MAEDLSQTLAPNLEASPKKVLSGEDTVINGANRAPLHVMQTRGRGKLPEQEGQQEYPMMEGPKVHSLVRLDRPCGEYSSGCATRPRPRGDLDTRFGLECHFRFRFLRRADRGPALLPQAPRSPDP